MPNLSKFGFVPFCCHWRLSGLVLSGLVFNDEV